MLINDIIIPEEILLELVPQGLKEDGSQIDDNGAEKQGNEPPIILHIGIPPPGQRSKYIMLLNLCGEC